MNLIGQFQTQTTISKILCDCVKPTRDGFRYLAKCLGVENNFSSANRRPEKLEANFEIHRNRQPLLPGEISGGGGWKSALEIGKHRSDRMCPTYTFRPLASAKMPADDLKAIMPARHKLFFNPDKMKPNANHFGQN